jgi:hypothetical protein
MPPEGVAVTVPLFTQVAWVADNVTANVQVLTIFVQEEAEQPLASNTRQQ